MQMVCCSIICPNHMAIPLPSAGVPAVGTSSCNIPGGYQCDIGADNLSPHLGYVVVIANENAANTGTASGNVVVQSGKLRPVLLTQT